MRISEFRDPNTTRLAALAKFLLGRARDTEAVKPMSVDTFIDLARDMKIDITPERLQTLSTQDPLRNIIADIQGNNIIWQGSEQSVSPTMSVDTARATVNQMAKRAIDIK